MKEAESITTSVSSAAKYRWHLLWPVVLLAVLVLFLYQPTFAFLFDLWTDWDDGEYSHGLLIILISFYLLWRQSKLLGYPIPLQVDIRLVGLVGVFSALWGLAVLVNVHMVEAFMVFAIYVTSVLALMPKDISRKLLFPLLYLFLAIPIWLPLLPILQKITIIVVYAVVQSLGIPTMLEGHVIHVPGGSFAVETACSGLRYFLSALALSTLYGYLNFRHIKVIILFVLGALIIAVVANWIRVFAVIYAGYATGMTHPWVNDHVNLGWYLFAGLLFPYLWFAYSWFARLDDRLDQPTKKQISFEVERSVEKSRQSPFMVGSLLVMIVVGPLVSFAGFQAIENKDDQLVRFPVGVDGWISAGDGNSLWKPQSQGADLESQHRYDSPQGKVDVYIAHYLYSRDGAEPIDYSYSLMDRKQWLNLGLEQKTEVAGRGVIEMRVRSKANAEERVVWYWHHAAGRATNSTLMAKLFELWGWVSGESGISIVAVSARYDIYPQEARHILEGFIGDMAEELDRGVDKLN